MLLELTAISGEYPADNLHLITTTESYGKKVITTLTGDKLIKIIYKSGLRGYKLAPRGKRKLLEENPARFEDYLVGEVETNRVKTIHTRRLRLHAMAQVYTLLYKAGVEIFKDIKPDIFNHTSAVSSSQPYNGPSAHGTPGGLTQTIGNLTQLSAGYQITTPCFYSSREFRRGDGEAAKPNTIRGSRAAGALLTPTNVYAVYNTGNTHVRWGDKVEQRLRAEIQSNICRRLFPNQYSGIEVSGILMGASMDSLWNYLDVKAKQQAGYHFIYSSYKSFYFITNDSYGETQLRLLIDDSKGMEVRKTLMTKLYPPDIKHSIEHDALTEDGTPVLFCYLLDMPRLIRFRNGLELQGKVGKFIAFDFQKEVLCRFLGKEVDYVELNYEKFVMRFF